MPSTGIFALGPVSPVIARQSRTESADILLPVGVHAQQEPPLLAAVGHVDATVLDVWPG